jgi:hypothetical protein
MGLILFLTIVLRLRLSILHPLRVKPLAPTAGLGISVIVTVIGGKTIGGKSTNTKNGELDTVAQIGLLVSEG